MPETIELCFMCDQPIDDGDDPGYVFMDNGVEVPVCSDACAEKFYA